MQWWPALNFAFDIPSAMAALTGLQRTMPATHKIMTKQRVQECVFIRASTIKLSVTSHSGIFLMPKLLKAAR